MTKTVQAYCYRCKQIVLAKVRQGEARCRVTEHEQ